MTFNQYGIKYGSNRTKGNRTFTKFAAKKERLNYKIFTEVFAMHG